MKPKLLKFILTGAIVLLITQAAFAQRTFQGEIVNDENCLPIPYASVGVLGYEIGTITDSKGMFKVNLPQIVKDFDTILITSIGYKTIKVPVPLALHINSFPLKSVENQLPTVYVHNMKKNGFVEPDTLNNTYYRGWYEYRTGGEIGKVIRVLHKNYKLNRIAFQVDNKCDTCWLRLRLKKVFHNLPTEDILTQSIIIPMSQHTLNDGLMEFDVSDLGIFLNEKKIYVGFEIIDCKNIDNRPLSLCFIGTDYGDHYYRKYPSVDWKIEYAFSLYLKIFVDY